MQYRNKPKKQQVIRDNIDSCKRKIRSKRHFYAYVKIQEKRKRISFELEEEHECEQIEDTTSPFNLSSMTIPDRMYMIRRMAFNTISNAAFSNFNSTRTSAITDTDITFVGYSEPLNMPFRTSVDTTS